MNVPMKPSHTPPGAPAEQPARRPIHEREPVNPDPKTHPIHPAIPSQPIHEGTDPPKPVTTTGSPE
jgi:hypothetical protein